MSVRRFGSLTRLLSSVCASSVLLAGCATDVRQDAQTHNAEFATEANQNLAVQDNLKGVTGPANVHIHHGLFLGSQGIRSKSGEPLPTYLEQSNSVRGLNLTSPLSLDQIARDLSNNLGIRISTENISLFSQRSGQSMTTANRADSVFGTGTISSQIAGVPTAPMVVGSYQGALSPLLDKIANHFDVDWRYHNGVISFIGMETREFTLASLPTIYTTSSSAQGSIMSGTDQGAISSGGSGQNGTQNADTSSITMNYWSQVNNTLSMMLPKGTLYSINQTSGTITVTARPSILDQVETYVRSENQRLLRQVQVSIKILDVEASNGENYHFNPSIVFNDAAKGIAFSYAGPAAMGSASGLAGGTLGVISGTTASKVASEFAGSTAALQALSQRTNSSLRNQGTVVAMNNQLAPLSDMDRQGYLAQMTQTLVQGASTSSVSLTPGTVNTGFSMSVLPRIQSDNTLILSYKLTISELLSITQVGTNTNFIQVPHVTNRSFYESVHIRSGDTIVMAGIRHNNNSLADNGVGKSNLWMLGGGTNTTNDRREVVVLITPTILDQSVSDGLVAAHR